MITTVLGEIEAKDLGITSSHEHIFIDMRHCVDLTGNEPPEFYGDFNIKSRADVAIDPYAVLDNALIDNFTMAIEELEYFKVYGGQTLIDCTLDEIYTVWVKSDVPICARFGRLDVRQTNMAYYSVEGYSF